MILPFRDEIAQGVDILVVDLFDIGDREAAETLATEQQGLLVALWALVGLRPFHVGGIGREN